MAVIKSESQSLVTGAVLLAAALSLFGSIRYWDAESTYQSQTPDPYRIADQAARLEDLRAYLPADSILGYLTDLPAENILASSMFLAAQYALAPRLLQKTDSYKLVLGNFTKPADFASVGEEHGLRVERDFGNGVVLFRREAQ